MSFTSRVKIEDLINNGSILVHKDGNHGAKYPRTEEFGEVGVPFLTAKLLDSSGNIDLLNAPRLATEKAKKFTFGFVQSDDVLLSHNATVGRVAVMPQVAEPILIGTSLTHFRLDKSKILPTYLAAYFSGKDFQDQLAAVMSQTTRNQVPITSQRKLYIELPSIDIQTEIVKHIDSIDNKIRLNNQINQTLESIAQAIFKSWFIDFEPVRAKIAAKQEGKDPERAAMCAISGKSEAELKQMAKEDFAELQATAALFPDELVESELGTVPKGWSVQKIKDFGRVICGKTPSKSIAEYYGNDIPFIKIPDMHHDVFVLDSFEKLSEKGSNSQANKILPRGSICVSCIATVGKVIITHQPSQTNQQINSIVPDLPIYTYFLYFLMGEKERLFHDLASGGSATLNMNTSTFSNVDILMPNSKIIEAYDGVVSRIFDEILHNLKLSFLLSDMRDTLLPKLLSGEMDVSDLQSEGD